MKNAIVGENAKNSRNRGENGILDNGIFTISIHRQYNGHDFPNPDIPRAYPYGIYDVGRNTGYVAVGTDRDTSEFAVASIRGWWKHEGARLYPEARSILITADGGGSNGYRSHLWKRELQKFANEFGLSVAVCHFPPGTSKWNTGYSLSSVRIGAVDILREDECRVRHPVIA